MKKILAFALAIFVCLPLFAVLSACQSFSYWKEHEHQYDLFWSYDEEYHWHDCIKNCGAYSDYAPHEWDEGIVVREADEETAGFRTYCCLVCGKERIEEIVFDPSNGPTTTVTEEQMKRAFSTESLRNVTMTALKKENGKFQDPIVYRFTEEGVYFYYLDEEGNIYNEEYDLFTKNGYDIYKRDEDGNWTLKQMTKIQFLEEREYVDLVSKFSKNYSVFPANYEDMTYNGIDHQYELDEHEMAGTEVMYANLRFEAKRLTYFCFWVPSSSSLDFFDSNGGYLEFTFENYGITSFEVPQDAVLID